MSRNQTRRNFNVHSIKTRSLNVVLAIDHRANDGAQAAAFLKVIKDGLEAVGPETPVY